MEKILFKFFKEVVKIDESIKLIQVDILWINKKNHSHSTAIKQLKNKFFINVYGIESQKKGTLKQY